MYNGCILEEIDYSFYFCLVLSYFIYGLYFFKFKEIYRKKVNSY